MGQSRSEDGRKGQSALEPQTHVFKVWGLVKQEQQLFPGVIVHGLLVFCSHIAGASYFFFASRSLISVGGRRVRYVILTALFTLA